MTEKIIAGNLKLSFHKPSGQYRKVIGVAWNHDHTKLVKKNFYFGADAAAAITKAAAKITEWQDLVADWHNLLSTIQLYYPDTSLDKPFWLERVAEAEAAEQQREEIAANQPHRATIESARLAYIKDVRSRLNLIGSEARKQSTINTLEANLSRSLGALDENNRPIFPGKKLVSSILHPDLVAAIKFHHRKEGLAPRTALNYCRALQAFLSWMDNQPSIDFSMPKGAMALFHFGTLESEPYIPTMAEVASLFRACVSGRESLYLLLGINCGMYQTEISGLHDGEYIGGAAEPYMWWSRSKTSHQNAFKSLHWLFPETHRLLDQERAPRSNPHRLLLLNQEGRPLEYAADGHRVVLISDAFGRIHARSGVAAALTFKSLRKFSAHHIRQLAMGTKVMMHGSDVVLNGDDMARMFLGQRIKGVLRRYVRDDFKPLTEVLKRWHGVLVQRGVLAGKAQPAGD